MLDEVFDCCYYIWDLQSESLDVQRTPLNVN